MCHDRELLRSFIKDSLFFIRHIAVESEFLNYPARSCSHRTAFRRLTDAERTYRAAALSLLTTLVLLGSVPLVSGGPSVVYVDASYRTNGAIVTFPNVGGTGSYRVGSNAFNTIQAAVTNVSAGGTVHVAAGTYVENVPLDKPVSLLGPNAGKPGSALTRRPEAMLVPAINDPENIPILVVEASHVTIDGFLLDGHTPNPPIGFGHGYNANGVEVYAAAAIQNGCYPDMLDINHLTICNNIIRNFSYDGIYLDRYPFFSTPSGWNYIAANKFENMWEGLLTYALDSVIANNTITNVTHGLSVHGIDVAAPAGFVPTIISNSLTIAQWWPIEIEVTHAPGIWVNYRRGKASPLNVIANTINTPNPAPSGKIIRAMEVLAIDESGRVNFINNIVNGYGNCHEGLYAAACWSNHAATVIGGALRQIKNTGIVLKTTDPEWPPEWPRAVNTFLTVNNLNITTAPAGIGVLISQAPETPLNRAHVEVLGDTVIRGALIGVRVRGPRAGATLRSNRIPFSTGAVAVDVDGGRALLENNNLTGCTVAAIGVQNGGIIDAGDCTGGNVSGLGTGSNPNGSSAGFNILSNYGFDARPPWAITNSNSIVRAYLNIFGAAPEDRISQSFDGNVEFSEGGGLQLCAPPNVTVRFPRDIPTAPSSLAEFMMAGGNASTSSGTVVAADRFTTNNNRGYSIQRTYEVTDICGESATCEQLVVVQETGCTLSITNCSPRRTVLSVLGGAGDKYAILRSTNLIDWVFLHTNTVPFSFEDQNNAQDSCRFYRALYLP